MEIINLRTNIGEDGHLRVDIPTVLAPGEVEVVVVIQSPSGKANGERGGYDFSDLTHRLQWQGDALAAQRSLRDEWS